MKPMRCLVIRIKEKNMINTENTGNMPMHTSRQEHNISSSGSNRAEADLEIREVSGSNSPIVVTHPIFQTFSMRCSVGVEGRAVVLSANSGIRAGESSKHVSDWISPT